MIIYQITPNDIRNNVRDLSQLVFDVTQRCNLRCKYCIYSGMYEGFDDHREISMPDTVALGLLEYLGNIWKEDASGCSQIVNIGFFGGEPLLNFPLIEKIVRHTKQKESEYGRTFSYSMTTNAILLKRYSDFMVENDINLLISLDGDFFHNRHRVDLSGTNTFQQVFSSVMYLKERYPEYFRKYVSFNTVISSGTQIDDLLSFFTTNFGKITALSQINSTGIKKDRMQDFLNMYQSKNECMATSCNGWNTHRRLYLESPTIRQFANYIFGESGNVYTSYANLFIDRSKSHIVPTGTCIPFAKKMYLSAEGYILQCEKIDHSYKVGSVDTTGNVSIDYREIADEFNRRVASFAKKCSGCAKHLSCTQCLFQSNAYRHGKSCDAFATTKQRDAAIQKLGSELKKHPELYQELIENVTLY